MPLHTELDDVQMVQFFRLIHESLRVHSHFEFMLWSQGSVQQFLPHDIMIAAWGDFSLGLISFEIVSPLPDMQSRHISNAKLTPLLQRLFKHWTEDTCAPFYMRLEHGLIEKNQFGYDQLGGSFQKMKSAIVHAIKDVRGRQDCLYLLLSATEISANSSRTVLEALLPYIDCTLRQLDHTASLSQPESVMDLAEENLGPLSGRELEIMEWVRNGKTNYEIGIILDISAFTVKNHLQRIFKKLDVINRAQAVAKLSTLQVPNESV